MTKGELEKMSGAEQLRLIASVINNVTENFSDKFTLEQLIRLAFMAILSEYDFLPDQWTDRQVRDALQGYPPRWDDDEKPVYLDILERKDAMIGKIGSKTYGRRPS